MYKQFLTVCMVMAMAVSIAACGNKPAPTDPTHASISASPQATETTLVPTETAAPAFAEITLVDDDNCTVTIKSIDENNMFGYALNVFLENKTDKELMYTVDNVSVNGYMCDPFWAATVDAGKKANEQITFMESDFETNGIQEVTDITFTLQVYDSNDWTDDYLLEETFTINP